VNDGWYHVFGRGWERRAIFGDDRDRQHFLELLGRLEDAYRFVIHAYVLMENHHHLIVQTPDANLSRGMQWFNTSYSAWYNARHSRVGSLWQGRYRDVLIEDGTWAYTLSTYVHLNPLRIAGLGLDKHGRVAEGRGFREPSREQVQERLKKLRQYRWSSYRAYGGYCATPEWLTTDVLLAQAASDESKQRSTYRREVKQRLTYGVEADRAERLRDVIAIGSARFARAVRSGVGSEVRGVENTRALRRRVPVADIISAVERLKGEDRLVFCRRRGDWGRPLLLWALRRHGGVTLREAGELASGMRVSAVNMAIQRFCEQDHAARLQKELSEMLQ
jgi:REP element-mobilizing transposase RayT